MTQIPASRTSMIWLVVRCISPAKMEACCEIRNEAKAMEKMRLIYMALSPVSIFQATKFMFLRLGFGWMPAGHGVNAGADKQAAQGLRSVRVANNSENGRPTAPGRNGTRLGSSLTPCWLLTQRQIHG